MLDTRRVIDATVGAMARKDDHAAQYAEGNIDLTELNRRAAEAGRAATTADPKAGGLAGVTTADVAPSS